MFKKTRFYALVKHARKIVCEIQPTEIQCYELPNDKVKPPENRAKLFGSLTSISQKSVS